MTYWKVLYLEYDENTNRVATQYRYFDNLREADDFYRSGANMFLRGPVLVDLFDVIKDAR